MSKDNLITDIAKLTTIPEKNLEKLSLLGIYCIVGAVMTAKLSGKDTVDIDTGIGNLAINFEDDQVKYKFIPSSNLEVSVKTAILNEQNLLEGLLENSLINKVTATYKDLI